MRRGHRCIVYHNGNETSHGTMIYSGWGKYEVSNGASKVFSDILIEYLEIL